MDAEFAHDVVLNLISAEFVGASVPSDARLRAHAFGMDLPHPIGLAAGFDKNGIALEGLYALGFSFVEVGTVTPLPQAGNEKPRMFRLPNDEAILNRLGFNSLGAEAVARNLEKVTTPMPFGINIGKNRETPNEDAWRDYRSAARTLRDFGNYFVVNVSSPNTPGLRSLQSVAELKPILDAVRNAGITKPLFVKVSPDQSDDELVEIAELCTDRSVGLIATNTTVRRDGLRTNIDEAGGVSGRPLADRSAHVLELLHAEGASSLGIISVGGIFDGTDVAKRISSGAAACQIYTSFVYRGPQIIKLMLDEMLQRIGQ
jgi:dihydroorotate dehydrogenase